MLYHRTLRSCAWRGGVSLPLAHTTHTVTSLTRFTCYYYVYFTRPTATVVNTAAVAETRPTPLPQTSFVISHRIPICVVIDVAQIAFSPTISPCRESQLHLYYIIKYNGCFLSANPNDIHYEFFPPLHHRGPRYDNPSPPTDVYNSVYSVTELMNWVCQTIRARRPNSTELG